MCNLGMEIGKGKTLEKKKAKIGYRFFNLKESGFPAPVVFRERRTWHKKIARSDKVPTMLNESGLYIYRSRAQALSDGGKPHGEYVLCKVKYWGQTVEHDRGFRAQFAEIQSLMFDSSFHEADQKILKKFEKKFKIKPTKFRPSRKKV